MAMMTATTPKVHKAFYAVLDETHGILGKVDGVIFFFGDDGEITEFEPEMATFCTVLGEVSLSETARLLDTLHGAAPWICTHRAQEVA